MDIEDIKSALLIDGIFFLIKVLILIGLILGEKLNFLNQIIKGLIKYLKLYNSKGKIFIFEMGQMYYLMMNIPRYSN